MHGCGCAGGCSGGEVRVCIKRVGGYECLGVVGGSDGGGVGAVLSEIR